MLEHDHNLCEQWMQFETLFSSLSAHLIKTHMDELDGEIEQALAQVREFFQADRCALLGTMTLRCAH
jgi:hypothetical protein